MTLTAGAFALAVMVLAGGAAARTMTGQDYIREKNQLTRKFKDLWLDGAYDGLEAINALLEATDRDPIYCPPAKLGLTNTQVVAIANDYLDKHPDKKKENIPMSFVLLFAAQGIFPCPEK